MLNDVSTPVRSSRTLVTEMLHAVLQAEQKAQGLPATLPASYVFDLYREELAPGAISVRLLGFLEATATHALYLKLPQGQRLAQSFLVQARDLGCELLTEKETILYSIEDTLDRLPTGSHTYHAMIHDIKIGYRPDWLQYEIIRYGNRDATYLQLWSLMGKFLDVSMADTDSILDLDETQWRWLADLCAWFTMPLTYATVLNP